MLAAADSQGAAYRPALETLCQLYWQPIYAYFRHRDGDPDAAQDLTQGFFAQLLEKKTLKVANPQRGKFRSFLRASIRNYMINEWDRSQALRRGGGMQPIPFEDFEIAEAKYLLEFAHYDNPERILDRGWALSLLDLTLSRLRQEWERSGKGENFKALAPFLTGEAAGKPYQEVAAKMKKSVGAVRSQVSRMHKRFGKLLVREVEQTVEYPEQVEEEIRYLFKTLGHKPPKQ